MAEGTSLSGFGMKRMSIPLIPLGDRAYLIRDLPAEPFRVATALNAARIPGLLEAVAAYDSVAIYVDPDVFAGLDHLPVAQDTVARRHHVPVCYSLGGDLTEVADRLAILPRELIALHANRPYRCAAVGFRPGFAYLGDLDTAIAGIPRRPTPRLRVEAGSVGITGRQTGVYPQDGPGGWWLIGRTPLKLVEPESGYYPIEAGDEVVFVPIGEEEFEARRGERL